MYAGEVISCESKSLCFWVSLKISLFELIYYDLSDESSNNDTLFWPVNICQVDLENDLRHVIKAENYLNVIKLYECTMLTLRSVKYEIPQTAKVLKLEKQLQIEKSR